MTHNVRVFWLILVLLSGSCGGNAKENSIVFMGDSITEGWAQEDPSFFQGKPYINRGISGQTTREMLQRFQKDVIDSDPSVVVILGGTNDIAEFDGPISVEQILNNIVAMTKLAQAKDVRVVLCSVLPAYKFPGRKRLNPRQKILLLNAMIKNHAQQNRFIYCDYYSPLVDERKGMKLSYSDDGIHPNIAGYKAMEPIIEQAIKDALQGN